MTINTHLKLFRQATFVLSCAELRQCPNHTGSEIALIGRSNVGKSSLINALTQQSSLARVSHTPGRTQQLNYFQCGSNRYMVDMPGYGFAKAPLHIVETWKRLSLYYFQSRKQLKCLYILIDGRHGFRPADLEFLDMLGEIRHPWPYAFIITKTDQLNAEIIDQRTQELRSYSAQHRENPDLFFTSSRTLRGPARQRQEEGMAALKTHMATYLDATND